MKKYFIAAMAASLLILAGCSDKYQSELNMADVEAKAGKATIQGLVTYNSGTTNENGTFVTDNVKPAANVDVLVSVAYKAYGDGVTEQGKKQFTAKTDANGKYA